MSVTAPGPSSIPPAPPAERWDPEPPTRSALGRDIPDTRPPPQVLTKRRFIGSGLIIAATILAPIAGTVATAGAIASGWYDGLAKPAWTPPAPWFGPIWAVLYVLMAAAAIRVIQRPRDDTRGAALSLYLIQIGLNALWPWLFFGLRSPALGLVGIVVLDVAVVLTLVAFWSEDRPAGVMLLPYLAWLGFATALNGAVWFGS